MLGDSDRPTCSHAHCKSCDYFLGSKDFWEGSGDLCNQCVYRETGRRWPSCNTGVPAHATVRVRDFVKKEVVEAIVVREVEHQSDQFGKEQMKLNEWLKEACAEKAALQAELEQVYSQDPKLPEDSATASVKELEAELVHERTAKGALQAELVEARKENLQVREGRAALQAEIEEI